MGTTAGTTAATTAHITPALFRFFRELRRNNNRDWFQKNKARYQDVVRDPLLELVSDFAPRLHKLSSHLVADPRPNGGSLFRIYRDVRFSKDKTPYKTAAGVRFPHEESKNVHAPGYYLHLEPGSVFAGAGIWHPEPATIKKVRDRITADPKGYKRSISGKAFHAQCELGGRILEAGPPKAMTPTTRSSTSSSAKTSSPTLRSRKSKPAVPTSPNGSRRRFGSWLRSQRI